MSTLRDFFFAAGVMVIAGLAVPFLKKKFVSEATPSCEQKAEGKDFARPLYGLFLAVLMCAPAASFMLATAMDVPDRDAAVFLLMGVGVLLSLPLTLLIARLIGDDQYGKYWLYLEARSKVGRHAIVVMWLCVALMTLAIGAVMLFDGGS
jgi:hypothetical protein